MYVGGAMVIASVANDNKEPLVMAKCPKPVQRIGNQVFSVRLDF